MSEDSCTIIGSLGIVLRISSMVGIAPINLTRNPRGYVGTVSRGRPLRKYIAILLLAIGLIVSFLDKFYPQLSGANVETSALVKQIEDTIYVSLLVVITIIAIFNGKIRMKQTIKHLNQIEEVNNKLEHNNINVIYNDKLFLYWFLALVASKILGTSLALYHATMAMKAHVLVGLVIQMMLFHFMVLIELQYVFKICLLNETMRALHKKLYNLIFKYDVFGSVIMYSTEDNLEARNYCRIYLTIRHIIYKINKQDGLIVILLLTTYFVYLINFVHFMTAHFIFEIPIIIMIVNIILTMLWFITIIIPLFLLVEPCHQTSQEVQKIHTLLSQLMSTSMERQISKEFSIFSQHYFQHSPVFCPLGMVTLTRPLFLKIAGSILTFLSLISQFNLVCDESFLQF